MKRSFVHEKALCETKRIGEGTRILAFSHVLAGAAIGKRCYLGEQVFVENRVIIGDRCTIQNGVSLWDEVTLENDVFVGPNVVFTNDLRPRAYLGRPPEALVPTRIRRGAALGANATIVCGVTVGEFALVGAGAVVTKDVPPHGLVAGNPARLIGRVCFCGERLDRRDFCGACRLALEDNSLEKTRAGYEAELARRRPIAV